MSVEIGQNGTGEASFKPKSRRPSYCFITYQVVNFYDIHYVRIGISIRKRVIIRNIIPATLLRQFMVMTEVNNKGCNEWKYVQDNSNYMPVHNLPACPRK